MDRKRLGDWGEEQAANYLKSKGLVILERKYRCKIGEMDLVAFDGEYLVFIEVKTRTSNAYGFPVEAVGKKKQNKYIQMASIYAKEKGLHGRPFRFDIVEVMAGRQGQGTINHIPNAFHSTGGKYYL